MEENQIAGRNSEKTRIRRTQFSAVPVKNTEVNNGLRRGVGLNAMYDSNNKGRQRVRIQYPLQPKRLEAVATEDRSSRALGMRLERVRSEVRESHRRRSQDRSHLGTGHALSSSLPPQFAHPEQLRESQDHIFDDCREQADGGNPEAVPMDLLMLEEGKKGKGDKKSKGKGKTGKVEDGRDEKKGKDKNGKGKDQRQNDSVLRKLLLGGIKAGAHMKKDCWWNDTNTPGKDAASLESTSTCASQPDSMITGMSLQSVVDNTEADPTEIDVLDDES